MEWSINSLNTKRKSIGIGILANQTSQRKKKY
jgi:hypothetical protein